jgi:hypothetical protein
VQVLLNDGADQDIIGEYPMLLRLVITNVQPGAYGSALCAACAHGKNNVIEILCQREVTKNSNGARE